MDYEQKYNEALERARQIKGGKDEWRYSDLAEITPALTEIFPELAESEDERIRKEIVDFLRFTLIERGIKKGKEKAEKWIAYLERQKENPKTADSIPSDCVSDAKCEDRWHKVGDSLPDNPREVLCKDEAGNYFIGRYYVGEGWEISNYDDEDKPHHLNPPVSKWIDFPSEKQKESLHIPETCKGNSDSFTSLEEAAENAICMAFGGDPAYYDNKAEFSANECMRLFIAGAECQKEQMLKEAEECELICIKDCLAAILPMKEFQWTVGDKVKVIVLKAEDE